ncbi:ankyrin repeat domain-containing protein [Stackebrandtia albiflava]
MPQTGVMSDERDDAESDRLLEIAEAVFDMARSGDTPRLEAYLEAGTPVDLTNAKGDTLLMLAAYHGHAETVSMLLRRGADPQRANDRGQTPLAGAVFKAEDAVVEALLAGGADPSAGTPSAEATARMFGQDRYLEWFAADR